nr:winged helix-turn-helix domain-containing protein [Stappia indica]
MRVPEAAERIADQFGLHEAEREEMLPSGRQRVLHNRIHWAKFYMTRAGLIDSPRRGVFTASEEGRALLANSPATLDTRFLQTIPAFAEFYATNSGSRTRGDGETSGAAAVPTREASATTGGTDRGGVSHAQRSTRGRPSRAYRPEQPGVLRKADRRSAGGHGLWRDAQFRRTAAWPRR